MRELKLAQIWIYPIKSLGGIPLNEAKVMAKGLQYDRRWMLVDQDGVFITQRVHSNLALFHLSLGVEDLVITYHGDTLQVPINHELISNPLEVQIWDDKVITHEVSKFHSQWFSERLGIDCRLVVFPEENDRQIDRAYASPGEHVSLADGFPILIVGQSSLDELNSRLPEPITMKRFRPNFVVTGSDPYEEDTWKEFGIGSGNFEGIKPCGRCVLTTVDPETGNKGKEPLKTLAGYRRWNNNIYFGQNVIARTDITVRVGDAINVYTKFQVNEQLQAIGSIG